MHAEIDKQTLKQLNRTNRRRDIKFREHQVDYSRRTHLPGDSYLRANRDRRFSVDTFEE